MTRNKNTARDFTGDPVVKTFPSNAEVQSLVRELRSCMPRGQKKTKKEEQNIKQKQYCNKVKEDFKNDPHRKQMTG